MQLAALADSETPQTEPGSADVKMEEDQDRKVAQRVYNFLCGDWVKILTNRRERDCVGRN